MKKLILLLALSLSAISCTTETESTAKNVNNDQAGFNFIVVQSQSYDKCQLEDIEDYNGQIKYFKSSKLISWDGVYFDVIQENGNKVIFIDKGDETNYLEFELSTDSKTLTLYALKSDLSHQNDCPSDVYYSEKQN